jgi:catechol 1,2-dioxygenase
MDHVRYGICESESDLTALVRKAMSGAQDARLRQVLDALVEHAHAFVREVDLTEQEFEKGLQFLVGIGQATHEKKNEVVLAADVLGISTLVALRNNPTRHGQTAAALLGPFYRGGAPECELGASIARSETPGEPLLVRGQVRDIHGRSIAGALVDVWQASPVGLYENQDPRQENMNLRGKFRTDAQGRFHFRSVRPAGYPVPIDGPVGELLALQRRHPYRPAHLHFMVSAPGHKTLITQVFADDSEHLESDVVFGTVRALVGNFVEHHEPHPEPPALPVPYCTLDYDFVLEEGVPSFPTPPIP